MENDKNKLILDCGAGYCTSYYENVIYFDIADYPTIDVRGVGEELPFLDESFDAVFSMAVLEHVKDPKKCAAEIRRVLKPGGKVYFDAVFMQPFHGFPSHYFNFTPSGARLLFEEGFELISQTVPPNMHPIFSLTWLLHDWISGLEGDAKEKFLNMKIGDFVSDEKTSTEMSIKYWKDNFVTELPEEIQKQIAAGTKVIAKKI